LIVIVPLASTSVAQFQNDKIMAAFRAFEAYDPAANTWEGSLPRMRIPRHGFAGAVNWR
jgi:hypothetical protein